MLTSSIKQTQCVRVVTDHYSNSVVIEHLYQKLRIRICLYASQMTPTHSRDVFTWELVCSIRYQQTRLV
jgi:hypothetical protein